MEVMITCSENSGDMFQNPFCYEVGDLSFYIYLLHIPTMYICQNVYKVSGTILDENLECVFCGVTPIVFAGTVRLYSAKRRSAKLQKNGI